MQPVRVVLAEDHQIVREGLAALLNQRPEIRVIGQAADGHAAVEAAKGLSPDVVVMDLSMPGLDGVAATRQLAEQCPDTKVLVLSMHAGEEHVRPALRAGAAGYLVKGSGLSDLVQAILDVAAGKTFLSPQAAAAANAPTSARGRLTAREREVLVLVAAGKTTAQIATTLGIGVKTVEGHRSSVLHKLNVANAAELVREATKRGLLD